MAGPLYRGQGNAAFRTSQPERAARRGQTVPYDSNGAPTGATVNDNSITDAKLADMAEATIKGRAAGAGTGDPQNLSAGQVKTILALTAADISGLGYFATGTDAANLSGTVAAARLPQFTGGDVTTGGAGSVNLTIANGAVTLAKQANVATGTVFYRKTAGAGAPEVQTLATLKADLGLTGTNSGDQTITLTGDVTGSGTGSFSATIGANAVTFSKFVAASAASMVGATAAGNFAELTPAQSRTVMGLGSAALEAIGTSGATVPLLSTANTWAGVQTFSVRATFSQNLLVRGVNAPSTGAGIEIQYSGTTGTIQNRDRDAAVYNLLDLAGSSVRLQSNGTNILIASSTGVSVTGTLSATGAASASNLSGTNTGDQFTAMTSSRFLGRVTAGFGAAEELTGTQATALLNAATTSLQGAMSAQDKTRLDASFTRYHSLLDCSGWLTAADAAATYGMGQGQKCAVSGTGTQYPLNSIYIASADYPVAGTLNPKLRIRVVLYCNDVAPGVTFTIGLHPITRPATSGGVGLAIYTIGTAVASSTVAIATPAADSSNVAVTAADFALPADGHYVIGVVTSGGALAASSHVHISAILQMRYA